MIIIVLGLGSMGKRRIRLLQQIDKGIKIVGVDTNVERCEEASEKFGITTVASLEEAMTVFNESPIGAVISTSPLSHNKIISDCLDKGLSVFTELNLVSDGYRNNIEKAAEKGLELFLSSTFLYRDEIKYIKNRVWENKLQCSYNYHIGQYLPDWHPWESYRNFFVGDKRTNGCREIMAIEFPWIINVFGEIVDYQVLGGRFSSLNIDYPDTFHILLKHKTGVYGSVVIDVVSRKAVRNFEVYGEQLYLSWDGSASGLEDFDIENRKINKVCLYENIDHQEGYSQFVVENAYKNELISFLDQLKTHKKAIYDFEDDLKTLSLIDDIEAKVSMQE